MQQYCNTGRLAVHEQPVVLPCRTAEACHAELSFISRCTRQLVSICQATAGAVAALATAAAEFISTSRTAQQAARLQLAVSSGRLAMLLLLVLLGAFSGYSAVWSTRTTRRIGIVQQVQQLFDGLQQSAVLFPWVMQKTQRSGWLSSWRAPTLGWCVVKAVGKRQQNCGVWQLYSSWSGYAGAESGACHWQYNISISSCNEATASQMRIKIEHQQKKRLVIMRALGLLMEDLLMRA
jgi:hypothetical protein